MKQYTKLEQDAINGLDAIIATAADNALKFKNTAMESASASRMVLCFIFGAALILTILMLGILRKRIISPIYVLLESADQVAGGSDQVAAGAQMLSQGATEQASSVEELAATINELTSHVAQNADSASNATRTAEEVKDYAVESGKRMAEIIKESLKAMENGAAIADETAQSLKVLWNACRELHRLLKISRHPQGNRQVLFPKLRLALTKFPASSSKRPPPRRKAQRPARNYRIRPGSLKSLWDNFGKKKAAIPEFRNFD